MNSITIYNLKITHNCDIMINEIMVLKKPYIENPYTVFLKDLNNILKKAEITPFNHSVISATSDNNDLEPSFDKVSHQIGQVIMYIDEHLTEQLNLDQLSGQIALSKFQFIRLFRNETGSTPWKYLMKRRIELAKELLKNGMLPGQTAAETGFYDQSHLIKVFRQETGLTPKEYQEKNFLNRN